MTFSRIVRVVRNCMPLIVFAFCYTPRIGAYCFYNRSGIPEINVFVFPDQGQMKSYLEATNWTKKAVDAVLMISKQAGAMIIKTGAGVDIAPVLNALGDNYKYMNINYWLGQLLTLIYDNTMRKAYHVIKNGDKACWNWQSIREQTGKNRKTFTFLVLDARENATDKVLFSGDLNICAGLVLTGPGKLYQTFPFLDSKGQTVWLTIAEGKNLGYKVAGYVGL